MSIQKSIPFLIAGLAGLLVWQVSQAPPETTPGLTMASWANTPETLDEAIALSDEIVMGRVTRVRKAADLSIDAPGEPEGVHTVPVQSVTIRLEKTYKEPADRRGRPETIEVFHTGGLDDDGQDMMVAGDPEYRRGQRYMLFLTEGPQLNVSGSRTVTRSVISPEGRFKINDDGTLEPVSKRGRGFQEALRGRPAETLEQAVEAQTRGGQAGGNRP